MGEAKYTNLFSWAESEYPGRLATRFAMNHQLAHRIYAGSDMFLMPSQFEPCGLSQMIAMRYGSVPIARETGGLRDTVLSYNKFTDEGNGFTFFNYNAHDMLHTVRRAVHYYNNNRDVWYRLIVRGMTGDYSWYSSAGKYMALYEEVTKPATDFTLVQPAETENPKEAPTQSAPRAESEASAEVGETPKKAPAKRAPRKKAEPKAEVKEEATAEDAPAKPKRAPRKKAEPKAEVKEEATAEEAPAKPKRAPRKKAEPKAEVKEEATAEDAPAKPKRAPRKKAAPKAEVTEEVKAEEKPAE